MSIGIMGMLGTGHPTRDVHVAGRGSLNLGGATVHALDEDDMDGAALVDAMAGALGLDPDRLRMALHGLAADYDVQTTDGAIIRWAVSTATGVEVQSVTFTDGNPKILQVIDGDARWWVDNVSFDIDGKGGNDSASGILEISGHRPVAQRLNIKSNGIEVGWGRMLTSKCLFKITCPGATVDDPVVITPTANGVIPNAEKTAAMASVIRRAAGGRLQGSLGKLRGRFARGAKRLLDDDGPTLANVQNTVRSLRAGRGGVTR